MVLFLLFVAALLGGVEDVDTVDVYLFGTSYHPGHASAYEQWNPGLGVGLTRVLRGTWCHVGAKVVTAAYRDSFGEPSAVFAGGPKVVLGDLDGFHVEGTLAFGYLHGSAVDSLAWLPHAGVGWGPVTLEGFYAPQRDYRANAHPPGHPDYPMTSSLGAWLRLSFEL